MRTKLGIWLTCLLALTAGAKPHTWNFTQDGRIAGLSFTKGGRLDADFIRLDGTNVILKLIDGKNGSVALAALSEADQVYIEQLQQALLKAAKPPQVALTKEPVNGVEGWTLGQRRVTGEFHQDEDGTFTCVFTPTNTAFSTGWVNLTTNRQVYQITLNLRFDQESVIQPILVELERKYGLLSHHGQVWEFGSKERRVRWLSRSVQYVDLTLSEDSSALLEDKEKAEAQRAATGL